MKGNTEQLIRQLSENATPVRPFSPPWVRAALWLVLSIAYIGLMILIIPVHHDISSKLQDDSFILEQLAAFATGIAAAAAAFASVIPGQSRRWILAPVLPLAIWLGSLGPGCLQEVARFGLRGLPVEHNPWCAPFIVLFGAVPAAAIAAMLRRGAPLTPRMTAALAGLAAAGLANVGVRLIHPEDVSVMLLVWHVGAVMLLAAAASRLGPTLFNWKSLIRGTAL
jgi:hypothetical protein